MTAGAQNVKKETVNESQSRGQNNGGQTRQRFTGGDERTAQRKRLNGIRHQAGANENPERPQDSQAGAGLEGKADKPKCGQGRRPTAPQASPPPQTSPPGREAGQLLSETFRQFLIKRNRRFGARSRDPAFPRLGVRLPGRNGNARPHKADVNAHGNARGGLTHSRNKAGHDIDPSPDGR